VSVMVSPRVSVIIPVYNLRAFVAEAIESALAQTLPPDEVELVVVDDGSTDGSGDVVRRYEPRVRHLRQPNRGLSAARNAGGEGGKDYDYSSLAGFRIARNLP